MSVSGWGRGASSAAPPQTRAHQDKDGAGLQMWRSPGLRLHATWQSGGDDGGGEGRVGERRRREEKIGVIIMCLQYALYNAIKMSLSRTVCGGYNLCFWQAEINFSCLFHSELYAESEPSSVWVQRMRKAQIHLPKREAKGISIAEWQERASERQYGSRRRRNIMEMVWYPDFIHVGRFEKRTSHSDRFTGQRL